MPAKLSEGDTVGMAGEVTIVHDDGSVTVRLHGFGTPIETSGEHLSLVAKRKPEPGRRKRCATWIIEASEVKAPLGVRGDVRQFGCQSASNREVA